ncbi:YicC/YloC family endoribonuclease [Aequorivita sp. SDUM287046]|uniref:YicC/YloC family endoribonuclease n=1 Tax=Aequorivita aurantiaca TaxID=3053356 RepID=A0ABT8DGH8_9FLAO|nr:YicC/YloC family endoribonuclease [Aequorivita aurantiaca]MDN3722965.1 YicC/YloC family endoribonuclease [Aequorivita aurantiaca]
MIQSMTGYGKEVVQLPSKTITIEIKSLNSKGLDLNTRVPSAYREKELEIRDLLAKKLQRGKVDFSLYIEVTGEEVSTQLNENVVKQYIKQLANVVNGDPVELLKMAVRMPDALKTEREEIDETEYEAILKGMDQALEAINKYRTDEGLVLENDFLERTKTISKLLNDVVAIDPERMTALKDRLRKAVSELKEKVDENRFEQELIYYLEKYDITEEKVRLKNHLEYFEQSLNSHDSNGKKLGFITQEIGREINTIGSKANYAPMQQVVVQMKDELEKIKEQALNVL